MSTTIRVSEHTRDRFAKLSHATGRSMGLLIDDAADALERRLFFDDFSAWGGRMWRKLRGADGVASGGGGPSTTATAQLDRAEH